MLHRALGVGQRLTNYRPMRRLGFWTYSSFSANDGTCRPVGSLGALVILAHPAAFFLVAGYSESLFDGASWFPLLGEGGIPTRGLAALHGIVMSATRIVGLPCALAPLVKRIWDLGWRKCGKRSRLAGELWGCGLVSASAMLGGLGFSFVASSVGALGRLYANAAVRLGIEPDYLAIFKPSSYHWLLPALEDPRNEPDGHDVRRTHCSSRLLLLNFTGRAVKPTVLCASHLFRSLRSLFLLRLGVACVKMESMLRYEFVCIRLSCWRFALFSIFPSARGWDEQAR